MGLKTSGQRFEIKPKGIGYLTGSGTVMVFCKRIQFYKLGSSLEAFS